MDDYQVKEAINKYGLSLPDIKLKMHRQKTLKSYQDLVKKLGYHPSTPEIKRERPYIIHAIKKYWGSIFSFRNEYGFPNPKMGPHN